MITNQIKTKKGMTTHEHTRLDHFNEIIGYLTATHPCSSSISDEIIVDIKAKMVERGIESNSLTFKLMSEILWSMGLNKYLEDIPYLMQKIGGYAPPIFSHELREKLQTMFQDIALPPFRNMNYHYILLKLLQILNETNLTQYVPMLEHHHQKWAAHDEMWADVCASNDWPFYGMDAQV